MQTTENHPYTLVVGFDLSEQADVALAQAVKTAERAGGADIHILGVLEKRRGTDYRRAEEARKIIEAAVDARLGGEHKSLRFWIHTRFGNPAKEIVNLAAESHADLIVVGTHGRSGVERWMIGSVAERVVRYAPCPVLVARPVVEVAEAEDELAPEPPCPACVTKRKETGGAEWWCDVHSAPHEQPHKYSYSTARAQPNASAFGNFNPY